MQSVACARYVEGRDPHSALPFDTDSSDIPRARLLDQLLKSRARIVVLRAPRGYGASTAIRQLCDMWPSDLAQWTAGSGVGSLGQWPTRMRAGSLLCIDTDDGLSLEQERNLSLILEGEGNGCRIVIASRTALPNAEHMGASIQLIGPEELALRDEEVEALFEGRPLPGADVLASTEGWPLALDILRRAAEAPRQTTSSDAIAGFPGLASFFETSIAKTLSLSTIRLLTIGSLLDEPFSAETTGAIDGSSNASRLIDEAAARHAFVFRIDRNPGRYRLHTLFAQYLRAVAGPEVLLDLHRQAQAIFESRRDWDRAMRHAVLAQNYEGVANIAATAGGWTLLCGSSLKGVQWALDNIPLEEIRARPQIAALSMASAAKTGKPLPQALVSQDELLDLYTSFYQDGLDGDAWTSRLLRVREAREGDNVAAAILSSILALKHLDAGAFEQCDREAQRAIDSLTAENRVSATAYHHCYRARAETLRGNLALAEMRLAQAATAVQEPVADCAQLGDLINVHSAAVALERGQLDRCEALLAKGWPFLSEHDGWYDLIAEATGTAVRLALARHDVSRAFEVLDDAENLALRRRLPRLCVLVAGWRLVAAVASCNASLIAKAREAFDAVHDRALPNLDQEGFYLMEAIAFGDASHAYWCGSGSRLRRIMLAHLEIAHMVGARPLARRCLLLAALGADIEGQPQEAAELLREALEGADGADILLASLPVASTEIRRLLQSILPPASAQNSERSDGGSGADVTNSRDVAAVAALSPREREVLGLLGAGMTTKEIARTLAISCSTVKFHRKSIYAKLGVNRRSLAIQMFREHAAEFRTGTQLAILPENPGPVINAIGGGDAFAPWLP